jgi:hypothetical protein
MSRNARPKVEAAVFRPQTKIYQAPRFNDMDKMRALQSRLIQNIYTIPLAVRQVTQENLKEKNSGIDKKMVTLRPRKRKFCSFFDRFRINWFRIRCCHITSLCFYYFNLYLLK